MFGRRKESGLTEPPPTPGKASGKGRPTPKRTEAQRTRRQKAAAPRDRKEAARLARQQARQRRERARAALLAGDESALPARDRGPQRRLVRDIVDSRRNVAEWLLPGAFLVLLLSPFLLGWSNLLFLLLLALAVLDSVRLRQIVRAKVARRFPNTSLKGLTSYAVLRSTQLRRLRLPPPRVKRGASV